MKKFYSLALAALISGTAFGMSRQPAANFSINAAINGEIMGQLPQKQTMQKAPFDVTADITTLNQWSYGDLRVGAMTEQEISITVEDAMHVAIHIGDWTITALANASMGTIAIPNNQYMGKGPDNDDVYFYIKDFNEDMSNVKPGISSTSAAIGTFADGVVTFPKMQVWALGDPANESLGWYTLSYINTFQRDKFQYVGTGMMKENLIYPSFTPTLSENTESLPVEVYKSDDNWYRIKGAYRATFAALGAPEDNVGPDLIMDASNPDNILIEMQSTGLSSSQEGIFYIMSFSWYHQNFDPESELPSAYCIKKTEDQDKNVTITFPINSVLLVPSVSMAIYYAGTYPSVLTFSEDPNSISDVTVDNTDAPVEYYNLQGQRVINPAAGQLLIKKQGTKAEKTIIR
ncbi:MAG: hypothetical protein K2M79_05580 [Muribaculaceae bacterium]|nr:hypothetical protein [Muribaculaceae bacterium]